MLAFVKFAETRSKVLVGRGSFHCFSNVSIVHNIWQFSTRMASGVGGFRGIFHNKQYSIVGNDKSFHVKNRVLLTWCGVEMTVNQSGIVEIKPAVVVY